MPNEIISYLEMCQREAASLQRGMNFGLGGSYSVILMSLRPSAPYRDRFEDDSTLIYEGHDQPRTVGDPKSLDQLGATLKGTSTQNGLFFEAATAFKRSERSAELVRVYEKIRDGIWDYNGVFQLIDAWQEHDENRNVFKFKLVAIDGEVSATMTSQVIKRRRIIPTPVKLEVWKRDAGKCVICGATDELHFDHDLPFSKGGTSLTAENVQLLCARHNLEKRDKIV